MKKSKQVIIAIAIMVSFLTFTGCNVSTLKDFEVFNHENTISKSIPTQDVSISLLSKIN